MFDHETPDDLEVTFKFVGINNGPHPPSVMSVYTNVQGFDPCVTVDLTKSKLDYIPIPFTNLQTRIVELNQIVLEDGFKSAT